MKKLLISLSLGLVLLTSVPIKTLDTSGIAISAVATTVICCGWKFFGSDIKNFCTNPEHLKQVVKLTARGTNIAIFTSIGVAGVWVVNYGMKSNWTFGFN